MKTRESMEHKKMGERKKQQQRGGGGGGGEADVGAEGKVGEVPH